MMLMELSTDAVAAIEYERIDSDDPTIKAPTEMYYSFRDKFIKIALYDRRDRMQEILSQALSHEDKRILSVPHITNWFIEQVVHYLKQTKIHFFRGEHPNKDPDYGGPAWFTKKHNVIGFEKWEAYWLTTGLPIHRPFLGDPLPRVDPKRYKKTVYHELGHALDAAIYQALEKVKRLHPSYEAASKASKGTVPSGWYSQSQYDKLLQITKKGLVTSKTKTSKHKESVIEFFASLRELYSFLERNITPLDVRLFCMSRTTPLEAARRGNMSVALQYADFGLSRKQRQEPIAQEWTSLISQWVPTLPESKQDEIARWVEQLVQRPEDIPVAMIINQISYDLEQMDSPERETSDEHAMLARIGQIYGAELNKLHMSPQSSHEEVRLGDSAKEILDMFNELGGYADFATTQEEAVTMREYESTVTASSLVMKLSFSETIRMLDCTKHSNFIAEILNEML